MVQLEGAFVIVQPVAVEISEIVANSQVGDRGRRHRSIRRRQVVHHITGQSRHRHRLAGRDHRSRRNGLPRRRRIAHRHADVHRQHAGTHLRIRYGTQRKRRNPPPAAFVIGEEKGAVLQDRPAEREAILVPVILRLLVVHRFEEARGVQPVVLQEVPERAVEGIGARLRRHVHHRPTRPAELGRIGVHHHSELRHRIRRRLHGLVGEALVGGAVEIVVHAVEDEVVKHTAQAIHVVGALAPKGHRTGVGGV